MELSIFGDARLHWFYSFISQIFTQWLPHVTHCVEYQGHDGEDAEQGLHSLWVHSQAVETDIKCAITQIFTTVRNATSIKYKMLGETWLSLGAQEYFLEKLDKVRINTQTPTFMNLLWRDWLYKANVPWLLWYQHIRWQQRTLLSSEKSFQISLGENGPDFYSYHMITSSHA